MPQSDLVRCYAVTPSGAEPLPVPAGACDLHEALDDLPLGIYTGLRTFDHDRFLWLDEHLARNERCLALTGSDFRPDEGELRRALQQACAESPWEDARVRIDVLSGPAAALGTRSRVILTLAPLVPVAAETLESGVRVEATSELRRERPRVKNADFVIARRPYPVGDPSCYEQLLLDGEGRILEGSSSNFHGIRRGRLVTAGEGVLEGITRKVVLHVCDKIGVGVDQEAIALADVGDLDEALLTSSIRGVVPVVNVCGSVIGDGRPGPMTRILTEGYYAIAHAEACPAWPLAGSPRAGSAPATA